MNWSDERVELLKKLWIDGLSASQIAKQLGGVTRNAVIGKVHRLGLAGRATPSRPVKRIVRTRPVLVAEAAPEVKNVEKTRAKPAIEEVEASEVAKKSAPVQNFSPNGELIGVLDLGPNMCKWPIGDPTDADFGFCGAKTHASWPYCEHHGIIAYQPQLTKKGGQSELSNDEGRKAV